MSLRQSHRHLYASLKHSNASHFSRIHFLSRVKISISSFTALRYRNYISSPTSRPFSSKSAMTSSSTMTSNFMDAVVNRRSTYTLSPESTISDSEIKDLVTTTLEHAPSTFGSYTTRVVVLLKEEHYKLWDIIIETVKAVTPPEKWEGYSKARLEGFRNAYGTMLFLEDPENTRALEKKFPSYA